MEYLRCKFLSLYFVTYSSAVAFILPGFFQQELAAGFSALLLLCSFSDAINKRIIFHVVGSLSLLFEIGLLGLCLCCRENSEYINS